MDVTGGERALFMGALPSPTGARASGIGGRGGRRRTVGVVGNTGRNRGGRRSRIRRTITGKADNFGTSNNESVEIVGINIRPLVSVVHSRQGGEIAGRWFIGPSILHIDLPMGESTFNQRNTN